MVEEGKTQARQRPGHTVLWLCRRVARNEFPRLGRVGGKTTLDGLTEGKARLRFNSEGKP
jgi:hypothetical protein